MACHLLVLAAWDAMKVKQIHRRMRRGMGGGDAGIDGQRDCS